MAPIPRPSDHFTRFTSATPHASSYQIPRSSPSYNASCPPSGPAPSGSNATRLRTQAPPNETPAEKVARLRAAHRAAQQATSLSPLDRVIAAGRSVADRLHRGTAYGLMGLTAFAGCLSVYSFFSLMAHHRRQKRAWIDRELQRLSDAQTAFLRGEASAEQLHLLEQERAGEDIKRQAEEAKRLKKANSLWAKTRRNLYSIGGIKEEEPLGDIARRGAYQSVEREAQSALNTSTIALAPHDASATTSINDGRLSTASTATEYDRGLQDTSAVGIPPNQLAGGPLDQLAENITSAANENRRSWLSWASGRR